MPPTPRPTLHTLNGMRGIAAFAVVALHYSQPGWNLAPGGYLAVDLFFLLSGVVIAAAYDPRIAAGMTATEFMRVRLIRLYPMYLLGLIGCVALGSLAYAMTAPILGLQLLMLPAPPHHGDLSLYPAMQVAWSLLFELLVNLLFVTLHRWLTTPVLLITVAVAGIGLAFAATAHGTIDGGYLWSSVHLGLLRVLFAFPLGVLVWRHRARLRLRLSPWLVLPLIPLACALEPEQRAIYELLIAILGWPLLVIGASNARAAWPWLDWLGRLSYPVYCLHIMFRSGTLAPHSVAGAWATAGAVLVMAWAAERFYDTSVRAWIARRVPPARFSATAAARDRYSPAHNLPKGHE